MVTGVHAVFFTRDYEGARAFFRDVLGFCAVDAEGGWLIFALPPAELAAHPTEGDDQHVLYLMCDDVHATVEELQGKGAEFIRPISDERPRQGSMTETSSPGLTSYWMLHKRPDVPCRAAGSPGQAQADRWLVYALPMPASADEPARLSAEEHAQWWQATGAHELRQILYWRWDPIGISEAFPATWDEYDAYMGRVLILAREDATEDVIAAYLDAVESDSITLRTDEATRRDVARRVLSWYEDSLDRWQQGQISH